MDLISVLLLIVTMLGMVLGALMLDRPKPIKEARSASLEQVAPERCGYASASRDLERYPWWDAWRMPRLM
jgi:hypothetical protein